MFVSGENTVLTCNKERAFFTLDVYKNYNLWSCKIFCDAMVYLLDNSVIGFGPKLYRQTIGIPMGTNCAPVFYRFISILLRQRVHEVSLTG